MARVGILGGSCAGELRLAEQESHGPATARGSGGPAGAKMRRRLRLASGCEGGMANLLQNFHCTNCNV